MPNDMVIERNIKEDGYTGLQTINDSLLFEILKELRIISKKLDNLHRLYKP